MSASEKVSEARNEIRRFEDGLRELRALDPAAANDIAHLEHQRSQAFKAASARKGSPPARSFRRQ